MHWRELVMWIAVEGPAKDTERTAGRKLLAVVMWLAVGIIVIFSGMLAIALVRRARLRKLAKETAVRRATVDPWAEAGRRVEVPDAKTLDDERLDLDDTRIPFEEPPPENPEDQR